MSCMNNPTWRKLMDIHCPTFWLSHKQYLMSFSEEDFSVAEFLVWQAHKSGVAEGAQGSLGGD